VVLGVGMSLLCLVRCVGVGWSLVVLGGLDLAFRLRGTPDPESETFACQSAAFSRMLPSMEQEIDDKLQSNSR
jgi:hypothetical protein